MLDLKIEDDVLKLDMATLDAVNMTAEPGGGIVDYNLLNNKPEINGHVLVGDQSFAALGFATVAETGDYNDLSNKPTIPTRTSQLTNNGADGTSEYVEEDELATVAFTGNYSDLQGKPKNELFECVYGETTILQIADAIHANKLPYVNMRGEYYQFYYGTALSGYQFVCATPNGEIKIIRVDGRGWTEATTIPLEDTTHKVTSISSRATDVQYPSAKAVYTALQGKQNTLTFDQTPTDNSTNPVTSNGIYEAIEAVSGAMPTKTSDLENDGASGTSTYVEANTLARVATTGEYSDLLNPPTIGAGVLTIQKNATNVDTFSANATANKTINITVPTTAADVNALPSSTKYGASITVSINSTDYKITTTLKDQDGNTLGTAQVIDLPLESVVVNGTYDAQNKKIVLTLENGNTIDIPVGDLVAGLQTEITAQNPLNADLVDDGTSTHKFTTAANLTKLAGIEAGAEVNVQPDWDQATDTADDFIKNKPTKTSDFTNDGADGTAAYLETDETAYRTAAIPWGKVDSTSTNKLFTATVPGITEYRNGVSVWLKNGVVTSTTGFTVNINGLGGKKCYNNMTAATQDTTIFNASYTMLFVYDETLDSGNGGFYIYRGYDANTNTIGYQLRTNSTVLKTTDACRYYKIFFTSADGTHWVPASSNTANSATTAKPVNQRPINPFGEIVYCSANTNYAAEADIAASVIWEQYTVTLGYSFNRTGEALELTTKRPVYVKCAPQANGSAIMDADEPIVQALPSTDDGKIYIFLGIAYSATAIELVPMHPVYYFKDGAVRIWTGAATSAVQTLTAAEIDAICV